MISAAMTRAIPARTVSESTENGARAMASNRPATRPAARSHQLAPSQRLTTEMLTNSNVPPSFGGISHRAPADRPTPQGQRARLALHHVIRRELARMPAGLDLDGRVV